MTPTPETTSATSPAAGTRRVQEIFLGEGVPESGTENLVVNLGPSHPAMHGIVRIVTELDGEQVVKTDVEIGYLHRAFEKECEVGPYNAAMPYTDRLNYVSPLINNFGFCSAVEKLLGIRTTERCQYIRVILSEISRLSDHLTCVGATAMELGAFTVFLYALKAREWLFELLEEVCGARLTSSYMRIGGCAYDLPPGFDVKLLDILANPTLASILLSLGMLGILYELYLGRLDDALQAYQTYQTLSENPDMRVAGWVSDLERRIAVREHVQLVRRRERGREREGHGAACRPRGVTPTQVVRRIGRARREDPDPIPRGGCRDSTPGCVDRGTRRGGSRACGKSRGGHGDPGHGFCRASPTREGDRSRESALGHGAEANGYRRALASRQAIGAGRQDRKRSRGSRDTVQHPSPDVLDRECPVEGRICVDDAEVQRVGRDADRGSRDRDGENAAVRESERIASRRRGYPLARVSSVASGLIEPLAIVEEGNGFAIGTDGDGNVAVG